MKKLLLMVALIIASLTRCDQLLEAINQHNVQKVTQLLQQKKYDTTNYSQYTTAAREVVDRCQNDIRVEEIEPHTICKLLAAACVAASFYPIYSFLKTQYRYGFDDMHYNALLLPSVQFLGATTLASFIVTIGIVLPFIPLCFTYQEAIDVEKLILGHQFE